MAKAGKAMREHNRALAPVGDMDAPEVVGNRLYKIRYVAQHSDAWKGKRTQKAFADKLGWGETTYSNWELGRPIPFQLDAAVKLCEWSDYGVTLDYIFMGRPEDLGRGWRLPLKEAPNRDGFVEPPLPRRRG